MSKETEQLSFMNENAQADNEPVVCLGMTFKNDDERREYFQNELRKKLPELKEIEGFPIGDDEDIIALSDPPYYTVCPNPWLNDFVEEWLIEKRSRYGLETDDEYHREPFATDVTEGRSDNIYMAHNYHTKVPPKAIMRYILHYTQPGDFVFDGFCGTGMTGVAAALCGYKDEVESLGYKVDEKNVIYKKNEDSSKDDEKSEWIPFSLLGSRRAIINDLSPIATHIANNYNNPVNVQKLKNDTIQIINELEMEYEWIYLTVKEEFMSKLNQHASEIEKINDVEGLKKWILQHRNYFTKTNYYVLSDEIMCPNCAETMILWDVTIGKGVNDGFECPNCSMALKKADTEKVRYTYKDSFTDQIINQTKKSPVLINYKIGSKSYTKKPDIFDKKVISVINNHIDNLNLYIPVKRMPAGDEARRNDKSGITHTHQFYTPRNLMILAHFWEEAKKNRILKLSITSILLKTASLLHNIGVKKGSINLAGALPNSLYIPGNVAERNIFELIKGKLDDIIKADLGKRENPNVISCSSLGSNFFSDKIKGKIDYIFIDPPFGSNLMYSELNFLWESWLNVFTNNKTEAIVNKTQQKTIDNYKLLMTNALKECFQILKPGGWMTVEFSNTKAAIWNAIQSAIQEAGFMIANVAALNKGQGTYNAQTNPTSVTQDLVISAYKPKTEAIIEIRSNNNEVESCWSFVKYYLDILPVHRGQKGSSDLVIERTPRVLYDRMVSYHIQNGLNVPISSADFQSGIAQKFPIRDGMVFLENQVAQYDKKRILLKEFVQASLFVSDETSAIEWIRQQLLLKPQSRQDLQPNFMREIQHIAKHEMLPELDDLLYQNFLRYEGDGSVPDQIASYLRKNYKDLRGLDNDNSTLKDKAMNRWYVPDPNKQADLEKLREKALLREFENYIEELENSKKKLKQFRTEAVRAGFKKAWSDKDYQKIVTVGERLPESVIQEDDKLLMYYDNAQIRLGL